MEEEEGLIRYRGIWKRKEEGERERQEKICTVGRGGGGSNSVQWEEEEEGRISVQKDGKLEGILYSWKKRRINSVQGYLEEEGGR